MWTQESETRLKEVEAELKRMTGYKAGQLSDKQAAHMSRLVDEGEKLMTQRDTYMKAKSMGSHASPEEFGLADTNPGEFGSGISFKGFGPNAERRIRPVSMYEMDRQQTQALKQAALQRTPLKIQLGSKGIEHGQYSGAIRDKAAVTEGGLTPNLLPPIQQLGDRGFFGLPYELTRVLNFLPAIAMDGPGIAYFRHDSNGAEAGYTAEGATKPDISPVITEQYVRPAKIAGRLNLTHELLQDAGDEFAGRLQAELARSMYNSESSILLGGTTAGNGFNGINNVSGTLTRAIGSDSPLDCLNKAFADLRVDFFEPDLVFVHPNTMSALRREKDLQNRYILDLMQGPRNINQTNEIETLWGVPVVQTTQQTAGTAAVLSVQNGAAVVYIRESLTTFFDPYSQAASNIYQFIAETRLALATPRPGAINLVSGLPTS